MRQYNHAMNVSINLMPSINALTIVNVNKKICESTLWNTSMMVMKKYNEDNKCRYVFMPF